MQLLHSLHGERCSTMFSCPLTTSLLHQLRNCEDPQGQLDEEEEVDASLEAKSAEAV